MVGSADQDIHRDLGIKILGALRLGLEKQKFQPGVFSRLGDSGQQRGDLLLFGQGARNGFVLGFLLLHFVAPVVQFGRILLGLGQFLLNLDQLLSQTVDLLMLRPKQKPGTQPDNHNQCSDINADSLRLGQLLDVLKKGCQPARGCIWFGHYFLPSAVSGSMGFLWKLTSNCFSFRSLP